MNILKKQFLFALFALLVAGTPTSEVVAAEINHFKGEQVNDLSSALCNLKKYDVQLAQLTKQKMTLEQAAQVHELTYTLEVAIQKVQAEVNMAVEELENAHKGSEVADFDKVKRASATYLAVTQMLAKAAKCK